MSDPDQDRRQMAESLQRTEERLLRTLDDLESYPDIDRRWLQIGRTHVQQGFMAVVRALMQPQRVEL